MRANSSFLIYKLQVNSVSLQAVEHRQPFSMLEAVIQIVLRMSRLDLVQIGFRFILSAQVCFQPSPHYSIEPSKILCVYTHTDTQNKLTSIFVGTKVSRACSLQLDRGQIITVLCRNWGYLCSKLVSCRISREEEMSRVVQFRST